MSSRLVLVTGSTDGIGLETVREIARTGARVVVHGRHPDRVARAVAEVAAAGGTAEGVVFDLASFAEVRRGAAELARRFPRLDVLVNNAGVMMNERVLTADGRETDLQVNHLSPFLLTNLLLAGPLAGPGARIVNVASVAHVRGRIHFDDLDLARGFTPYAAYAQSKLANVLFTFALARRLPATRVTANCLHPGVVGTKLLREGFGLAGSETLAEGAQTSVYLATSPDVEGLTGHYFSRRGSSEPSPHALDEAAGERLWALSERLTGLA